MSYVDIEEDQDPEEFHDAYADEIPDRVSLKQGIDEAQIAINLFFNNKFDAAKKIMAPHRESSLYHAVGYGVFSFFEAILTFEQEPIAEASKALKEAIFVCNRLRKKNTIGESLGKIVKKNNYDQYTEEEAHAELCRAEALLLRAMLTFMEDETLRSFIKAGIKIRSCYNSYKQCQLIMANKTWRDDEIKVHFESGVKMGIGTFNLMISLLPGRVVKLLEFIGFSGNKQLGLEDLHKGLKMGGLRQILCIMTILGYNLFVLILLSHREADIEICEQILQKKLDAFPSGIWFLFFKGRLEFMKGNLDSSIEWYTKSWKSQDVWPQFHHICFWELLWLHCVKLDWNRAATFSTYLVEGSKWSRTIYSYQKAAIMCMSQNISPGERAVIDNLMNDVPKYKQRIAGKSLPLEKFAVKKSERYFNQNKKLLLPVIELMFIWNIFKIFKRQFSVAENIYKLIEKSERNLKTSSGDKYHNDNLALLHLLKGACLRHMGSPLQALQNLEIAISMQKSISEDHYIVPYAIVELALIEWENGNKEKAIFALEDAKRNYTGYSLESRLHFRIHTALMDFKDE